MNQPKPVLNKQNFVQRYQAGEFGNRCPSWLTLEEFLASGYQEPVHVRNRIAGGMGWYDVPIDQLKEVWAKAAKKYGEHNLYLGAMGPADKTRIFQGEVAYGCWLYDLTYTTVSLPTRKALARKTEYAQGIIASYLLRYFLCPNSFSWLTTLLNRYPDHVIEFSTYSVEWGTIPGFNTLFWEVRKY